jgi:hypothetical protein
MGEYEMPLFVLLLILFIPGEAVAQQKNRGKPPSASQHESDVARCQRNRTGRDVATCIRIWEAKRGSRRS